jgi:hypothetical protein
VTSFAAYFWSRVDKRGPDECWEWTRGKLKQGYGQFHHPEMPPSGKLAHRASYWLTHGGFDLSLLVCHRCDNPPCCNPAHLFLGTIQDNIRDRTLKLRSHSPLTVDDVTAIRASGEKQRVLAERYGVSQPTISLIRNRKTWEHAA